MTLGGIAARKLALKKKSAQLAAAFPNGVRCQKCLEFGHWSYECKGKRKFVHRTSRSKQLNKNLENKIMKSNTFGGKDNGPREKRLKRVNDDTSTNSSSDEESDSASSSSESSSGSSDSDSDSSTSSDSTSSSSSSSSSASASDSE
uniref:Putative zinc knuckle n=1 Tax=Tabanus bromius TaxID=304241 RepID=A0A0K8TQ43_TABBR